jgi:hypothetical protein
MNCGITGLFCCIRPSASVSFSHSKVEYKDGKAYMDVFLQVDRTMILDTDYLCLNKPPHLNTNNRYFLFRIFIMREPGNMSGVSRVTFPNESGSYLISYIRSTSQSINILGDITIHVSPNHRDSTSNTFDTEGYSPRFRASLSKRHSML